MTIVYIALGSNLDNPLQQVTAAVSEIDGQTGCEVVGRSPWYQSHAIGPGRQDDYINGVIAVKTGLKPEPLLEILHGIEDHHGRKRRQRWGPRTLDLDILLYGQKTINNATLQVPHPRMLERNFVIYPLAALAPSLVMPNGVSIASLLENVSPEGIVRLTVGDICGSTG